MGVQYLLYSLYNVTVHVHDANSLSMSHVNRPILSAHLVLMVLLSYSVPKYLFFSTIFVAKDGFLTNNSLRVLKHFNR
jgi:hypothetical protein